MTAVNVRIKREGRLLAGVGVRDGSFPPPHGRGEEFHHGGLGIDPRKPAATICVPDLHSTSSR